MPSAPPLPQGYTGSVSFLLSPVIVAWVPALCLTAAVLMTVLPWVGSSVAGHQVYSQNPWRAMTGSVARDFELEKRSPGQGVWLDEVRTDWYLMLPYLLCLIAAMTLAWADRLLAAAPDGHHLPPPLRPIVRVWPYREAAIAGLASLAILLVFSQLANGFGMQRAIRGYVAKQFEAERKAAGESRAKLERVELDQEQELAKFNLAWTTWLYLGVGFHILALLGVVARAWLGRRGSKPPPRFVLQY